MTVILNKVVARYRDGRTLKGTTSDFLPNKDQFHVMPAGETEAGKMQVVSVRDLKAIFFVKDFVGNPKYQDHKNPVPDKPTVGRRIKAVFEDGEVLVGTTQGYQPNRPGFFMQPTDANSNIERCFVVAVATRDVSFI